MTSPTGRIQRPLAVLGLALVTLGIYILFWLWRITKEVDAFAPGTQAHRRYRRALLLVAIGYAVLIGAVAAIAMGAASEGTALVAVGGLLYFAALVVLLTGAVFSLIAYWRVWKTIEAEEKAAMVDSPLSPGLCLALAMIPFVNFVGGFYVIHRTQRGLNGMWERPPPSDFAVLHAAPAFERRDPGPLAGTAPPTETPRAAAGDGPPSPTESPAPPPVADSDPPYQPPAAAPPPPARSARRFKHTCKQCGQVTVVPDTGERPLPVTCSSCGRAAKLAVQG